MMLWLPYGTLLVITPLSGRDTPVLTPYSARGLSQTRELIKPEGAILRDINARLQSLMDDRFRKYKTTITCKDGETPCLDDAWIGVECQIDCAFELSYPTGSIPSRPVVSGSSRTQGSVTYYRPQLTCLIVDIRASFAEWQAQYDWQIEAEEM